MPDHEALLAHTEVLSAQKPKNSQQPESGQYFKFELYLYLYIYIFFFSALLICLSLKAECGISQASVDA